jgi:hypothetical protein
LLINYLYTSRAVDRGHPFGFDHSTLFVFHRVADGRQAALGAGMAQNPASSKCEAEATRGLETELEYAESERGRGQPAQDIDRTDEGVANACR